MKTNPGKIVRVRARVNGRASVYEANEWAQAFSRGLLEGNGVVQGAGADMNVLVGGTPSKPDVVLAANPSGYRIALDLVGQQAVQITAPASNSRIASIVAYTDDLTLESEDTGTTGSPSSCGLIVVYGSTAAKPEAPSDTVIRTAITDDGAAGSQAAYGVIANITVAGSTTAITDSLITIQNCVINPEQIGDSSIQPSKLSYSVDGGKAWAPANKYFDIGPFRIQWGIAQWAGLNTSAGGYNTKTQAFPKSFGDSGASISVTPTTDTGGVAGGELKVTAVTGTNFTMNYNHTGSIVQSNVWYSYIAIGLKPTT